MGLAWSAQDSKFDRFMQGKKVTSEVYKKMKTARKELGD
jgi:hypothetical protein